MAEPVFKTIELTGTSKTDIEGAIQSAISAASETVHNLRWFEVIETRGVIEKDHVASWQVTIKLGFNVESAHPVRKEKTPDVKERTSAPEAAKKEAPPAEDAKTGASKYRCQVCGYIYDPKKGDPDHGIKPGTRFEDVPDSWQCPECGVNKDQFEKIN